MQVFKIEFKFQKEGRWSPLKADVIGYFVKMEGSDVIEGYTEMQYPTTFEKTRYIKGLYVENANQLVFVQFSNMATVQPVAYDFPNIENKGFFCRYNCRTGFFDKGRYEGNATVEVKEIKSEFGKQELISKVIETFNKRCLGATFQNQDLMKDVEFLRKFLDEKSKNYPKN